MHWILTQMYKVAQIVPSGYRYKVYRKLNKCLLSLGITKRLQCECAKTINLKKKKKNEKKSPPSTTPGPQYFR